MSADYWVCAVCCRRVSRQSHHAALRVRRLYGGWDHAKCREPGDENASRPRVIAATARLDPPRKPTKTRKLKQRREIQAWQEKSERKTNG